MGKLGFYETGGVTDPVSACKNARQARIKRLARILTQSSWSVHKNNYGKH